MTREQFIQLVSDEQEALRGFLLALCCGKKDDADDIAQDALVKAYLASAGYQDKGRFRSWLFKIAHNTFLNHKASQRYFSDIEEALKKYELIPERIQNQNADSISPEYAFRALCQVGGLDIAGMTGLFIGGSICSLPVMIDGAISAVSALLAECLVPGSVSFMIASHSGRERATGIVLKKLGLKAFLNGDMALGEGTGALMTLPLFDMAHDFFLHATTFASGGIRQYTRLPGK